MSPFHYREVDRSQVVSWHHIVSRGLKDCVVTVGTDMAAQSRDLSSKAMLCGVARVCAMSFVSLHQLAQVLVRTVLGTDSSC